MCADGESYGVIVTLREQLSRVRRRCEILEQRLEGEGAILLAVVCTHCQCKLCRAVSAGWSYAIADICSLCVLVYAQHKRHKQQLINISAHMSKLSFRASRIQSNLAAGLVQARQRSLLKLIVHTWHLHARAGAKLHEEPISEHTQAPSLPVPASIAASLSSIERKELYQYSYEALIDRVLEMQDAIKIQHAALKATRLGPAGNVAN